MNKKPNDGTQIMREHGVYPLLDTPTNDALLPTVCGNAVIGECVNLYMDAKGLHLVWRPVKRDEDGYAVWNGGNLLMETKTVDVTAEFAAKLDYDGEAPNFDNTPKDKDDATRRATNDWEESDDGGFVFVTDGERADLLLVNVNDRHLASLEHVALAQTFEAMPTEDIKLGLTEADILSKAKELLK